jgi:alkaline phosphatase
MKMEYKVMQSLLLVLLISSVSLGQSIKPKYTHSHNDYSNPTPFYKAFNAGFNSIEADIFLVGGRLLVSHDSTSLQAERNLKGMYLDPIVYALKKDTTRRLNLLIDVKDNYAKTLPALIKEIEPLNSLLMSKKNPYGRLKILISGNRPKPQDYKNYPDFLFFDDDLIFSHTKAEWDRVGQVSLNFARYSKWKGTGTIPATDRQRITHTIDSVHNNIGKLVRFWGGPDNPNAWNAQIEMGADIIGTDMIEQLADYLSKRSLNQPTTVVIPVNIKDAW